MDFFGALYVNFIFIYFYIRFCFTFVFKLNHDQKRFQNVVDNNIFNSSVKNTSKIETNEKKNTYIRDSSYAPYNVLCPSKNLIRNAIVCKKN